MQTRPKNYALVICLFVFLFVIIGGGLHLTPGGAFGPLLEESLFRGCLLPVLARTTGAIPAVIVTAVVFALFHGLTNLVHWVSFTVTGIAYGWMRVVSRSTTAPALMHAAYNLALYLLATT